MTRQNLSTGTVANDGSGDTLRSAATKINANFVELYNHFGGDSDILSPGIQFDSNGIIFEGDSADANELILKALTLTADRTVILPDASGDVVIDTATQTLTNKTLTSPVIGSISNTGTLTLPTSTDTIVGRATSDTLTNKIITSPTINTPTIVTSIKDTNGAVLLGVTPTASAVNNLTATNAGYSNAPTLAVAGADANINLAVSSLGTGAVFVNKVAYDTQIMTNTGTCSSSKTFIQLNKATAITATLADGTVVGEIKIFINKNAGLATVIPTNFAQGTSFALTQNGSAQCVWDGSNWFMIGAASTANALVTIT